MLKSSTLLVQGLTTTYARSSASDVAIILIVKDSVDAAVGVAEAVSGTDRAALVIVTARGTPDGAAHFTGGTPTEVADNAGHAIRG